MEKGICIISGHEGTGYPVKDDAVILALRRIKRLFGIAKNNRLIVSQDELAEYKKRRAKFEKNFVQYAALSVLIFAAMFALSLFAGTISLGTFAMPILIGILLVLLSLASYMPAIEGAPSGGEANPPPTLQKTAITLESISSKIKGAIPSQKKPASHQKGAKKKR